MKMVIEDYNTKQRDITYLKLTREVQEVIFMFDNLVKTKKIFQVLKCGKLRCQETKRNYCT